MAIIGRLYVVTLSLLSFFCPLLFFELGVRRNLRFTAGTGVSARLLLRHLFCYTLLLYIRSMSVHALEPLLLIFVGFLFIEMCGTPPRLAMRLRLLLERYPFSAHSLPRLPMKPRRYSTCVPSDSKGGVTLTESVSRLTPPISKKG